MREEDVSVVARQALKGLEYLYYQNVIHRDLKLGNILLKNQLLVKICDFGLAKVYCRTDKPTICGTPNYLAPEVLLHQGHRPVSDVWSLGCVLVVLLTGRAPFEGVSTEETYDMIMHKELAIPGKVSEETESFLVGLLTKQHRERMSVFEALEHPFIKMYAHILGQKIEEAKTEDMETAAMVVVIYSRSPGKNLARSPNLFLGVLRRKTVLVAKSGLCYIYKSLKISKTYSEYRGTRINFDTSKNLKILIFS